MLNHHNSILNSSVAVVINIKFIKYILEILEKFKLN